MQNVLPESLYYPGEPLLDTGKRTAGTLAGVAFSLLAFNRPPDWGFREVAGIVNYAGMTSRRAGRSAITTIILSAPTMSSGTATRVESPHSIVAETPSHDPIA